MAPKAAHMPVVRSLGNRSHKASLGAPVFCKPLVGRSWIAFGTIGQMLPIVRNFEVSVYLRLCPTVCNRF